MRRAALVLLACLVVPRAAAAGDGTADEHAFVEVVASRDAYFVEEPIRLRLVFEFDAEFFRQSAIQMFQQRLDVPAQVEAPWLRGLAGAVDLGADDAPRAAVRVSFALNDAVVEGVQVADRPSGGRRFTVVEVERTFLPDRPGELSVPGPVLRFAHAVRFEEDFVHGRVPVDRRDVVVRGASLALTVRALPAEGRPPEFSGAVGRFTAGARVDRADVAAGETFKLALCVEGEGNLTRFDAPRLDALSGFHVYGSIDDRGAARRTIMYDIAPIRGDVTEVPAIAFAFFDPGPPAAYRVARTSPIALRVRAQPGGGQGASTAQQPRGSSWSAVALAMAGIAAVGLLLFLRHRARKRERVDPGRGRVHDAAVAFAARAGRPDADAAEAFAAFLAACLDCPAASVIAPDLAVRLGAVGVPADPAKRAASLLERLVAARYGGGPPEAGTQAAVRALVDELAAILAAAATPR